MGRPRLHDQSTERELLSAAEALLAEGGVEALSIRRVAEAAGTTPRAIYSVFGDKDGLVRALFREAFAVIGADLDALPLTDDPIADLVTAGAVGFRGGARARPSLFQLAFSYVGPADRAPEVTGVEAFGRLQQRIRRCVDAGLIAPDSALTLGLSFHALSEGLASLEARGRFPLLAGQDPAELWRSALTALVQGFQR